jgi:protein NRD1
MNPAAAAPQQDTSAILEALKNMAKQSNTNQPAASAQPGMNNLNFLGAQNGNLPSTSAVNSGPSQAVNPLGAMFAGMSNGVQSQSPANVQQNPLASLLSQVQTQPQAQVPAPVMPQGSAPIGTDAQAQVQLIQLLISQGVPPEQWATALQLLNMQGGQGGVPLPAGPPNTSSWGQPATASRDREGYRSPPGQNSYGRRRSRSPDYGRRRDPSPRRRRDSPAGDAYRDSRRGDAYRRRSPDRRRRSPSPQRADPSLPPPGPRNIQYDRSLPPNHIKVLSRTLFVGGVTSNEAHLKSLFARFGIVQTCIVNVDKRHAFIKMLYRKDAERARDGMEDYRDGTNQLRVCSSIFLNVHVANGS